MRNENIIPLNLVNTSVGATSLPIQLFFLSVLSVQVVSTGNLAGRIEISVSNDSLNWAVSNAFPDMNLVVNGTAILNANTESAFAYIRFVFVRTGGTGNCKLIFNGKGG